MDQLFVATPSEAEIADALRLWPELRGKRIRPLLVGAFGDIFVETDAGEVLVASPVELACERVAGSVGELEQLSNDREWAEVHLLTEIALLARDRGAQRPPHQVFAITPHPRLTGSSKLGEFVPMNLAAWHTIASQLR